MQINVTNQNRSSFERSPSAGPSLWDEPDALKGPCFVRMVCGHDHWQLLRVAIVSRLQSDVCRDVCHDAQSTPNTQSEIIQTELVSNPNYLKSSVASKRRWNKANLHLKSSCESSNRDVIAPEDQVRMWEKKACSSLPSCPQSGCQSTNITIRALLSTLSTLQLVSQLRKGALRLPGTLQCEAYDSPFLHYLPQRHTAASFTCSLAAAVTLPLSLRPAHFSEHSRSNGYLALSLLLDCSPSTCISFFLLFLLSFSCVCLSCLQATG